MAGVSAYLGALNEANGKVEEGIYCYKHASEVPEDIQKYWHQRHRIFSKYDEGIWMTNNDWFGVTPEPVAMKIAEHLAQMASPEKTIIIDAFGGAGGNSIAFALSKRWKQVFYIEKNPLTLKCARHNAEVYGVKNKIVFIQGDCFEQLTLRFQGRRREAVLFASPPWGGPTYKGDEIFDAERMEPYSLRKLYDAFTKISPDLVLYLPRSTNLNQVAKYANEEDQKTQVIHYCVDGASKALCVYYGNFLRLP
ncbi:uncharacterized protein PV09_08119 [Verruconis gallopava]|uniref:Trimethylguanosine synthase n=1 Tax=Verruconis gallopava TaxID=253628 RepID=A0A0D2AMR7_9PEZI|nr:uncharacterized protein PV09_08119 [Verruconis gallopava]KIW00414.1 hypothetical protein PV09_08119 [Verruconis gallopava]